MDQPQTQTVAAERFEERRPYEKPAIVYRGKLEAYAVVCNQKGACTSPSS